jgi:DNA recombination protein RmuC
MRVMTVSPELLFVVLAVVSVLATAVLWRMAASLQAGIESLRQAQEKAERLLRGEMGQLRGEVTATLTAFVGSLDQKLELTRTGLDGRLVTFEGRIAEKLEGMAQSQKRESQETRTAVEGRLRELQEGNERKLEKMRETVDEKLQSTLEARLSASFQQVSERLEQVHQGLGEMRALAAGVTDLKRVLTNVRSRGTWGEIQLGALLEDLLAPEQFEKNVATTPTRERVEYAICLPGPERGQTPVYLPIDAKFPLEDYRGLIEASERGDTKGIEAAGRNLEKRLKQCARDIAEKYLAPPATTDFGILYLPVEGLYAEVVRRPGLVESLQRDFRVVPAGPTTLAALLNSLQMGFRTLAIQQRSSEVWELLGEVKAEFGKYAAVLGQIKRKLEEAQTTVEQAETRTRAIEKRLRGIETVEDAPLLEAAGGGTLETRGGTGWN